MPDHHEIPADGEWYEADQHMSVTGRVDLHGCSVGIGDLVSMSDPEHVDDAGVQDHGVHVILDMHGHLHPGGICIPLSVPFLLTVESLNDLIQHLSECRQHIAEEMAAEYEADPS